MVRCGGEAVVTADGEERKERGENNWKTNILINKWGWGEAEAGWSLMGKRRKNEPGSRGRESIRGLWNGKDDV